MISYEDGIGALEWLASAFGFRETARLTGPDGRLSHGEMRAGDGLIMVASPTPDYRGRFWSNDVPLTHVATRQYASGLVQSEYVVAAQPACAAGGPAKMSRRG